MTAQQSRKTVTARPVPGALAEGTAAFPYSMPVPGPRGDLRYENIVYSCEPGYRPLYLDLRIPGQAGQAPLIIWIHGGGWIYGSRRRLPPHLFGNAARTQPVVATPRMRGAEWDELLVGVLRRRVGRRCGLREGHRSAATNTTDCFGQPSPVV